MAIDQQRHRQTDRHSLVVTQIGSCGASFLQLVTHTFRNNICDTALSQQMSTSINFKICIICTNITEHTIYHLIYCTHTIHLFFFTKSYMDLHIKITKTIFIQKYLNECVCSKKHCQFCSSQLYINNMYMIPSLNKIILNSQARPGLSSILPICNEV